jgi:hypothetical protein
LLQQSQQQPQSQVSPQSQVQGSQAQTSPQQQLTADFAWRLKPPNIVAPPMNKAAVEARIMLVMEKTPLVGIK